MPTIEIEIGDDGAIGTLPEPVQKFLDKQIGQAHQRAYARAADEARRQVGDPIDRERLKQLEADAEARKIADAEQARKYDEAAKMREERFARDLSARDAEIKRRDDRLRASLAAEVRAAAIKARARDESLPELAAILSGRLDLDADLQPYVKGDDGKPAVDQAGNPVSIEGLVTAYLDTHQHHRAAPAGTGGGARGGATFAGQTSDAAARLNEAREKIARGDRSAATMRDFRDAQREVQAAAKG